MRGRRARLTNDQVARRMLDAAQSLVEETGLTVSLEHLSFEEVIQRARVSRSAAYRLWPYKDEFFVDLLCDLAGPSWQGTAAFDKETILLVEELVTKNFDRVATAEGRRWLIR